jgi:isoleucyl-tRNA synthetase
MDIQLRPEIDRWIISLLNSLIKEVDGYYEDFEPTKAARAIQSFVDEHLSNWYVRLCRRRFWKGEYTEDKISAYQTLYTCLTTISKLMSPIAPFYADRLFLDLNEVSDKESVESVHLADFPAYQPNLVDVDLEERMALAQHISSLTLSLRKKVSINVRQPLSKILLPVINKGFQNQVEQVKELILSETNIKDIEFITDAGGFISKKVKPNFKTLGPKVGQAMKEVAAVLTALSQEEIASFEKEGTFAIPNTSFVVDLSDVEMMAEDVPGWQVATLGALTVALDIHVSEELKQEGIARELVNRIQNLRKDQNFLVTDRIQVRLSDEQTISPAVKNNLAYICAEILADSLVLESNLNTTETFEIDDIKLFVSITKV